MVARSVLLLLLLVPASLRGQATDIQTFFELVRGDREQAAVAERAILDGWDDWRAPAKPRCETDRASGQSGGARRAWRPGDTTRLNEARQF